MPVLLLKIIASTNTNTFSDNTFYCLLRSAMFILSTVIC